VFFAFLNLKLASISNDMHFCEFPAGAMTAPMRLPDLNSLLRPVREGARR
jgi:hypothetical protein